MTKYLQSNDGVYRTTVRPEVRLERYQYNFYTQAAKRQGFKSLKEYLSAFLNNSLWREVLAEANNTEAGLVELENN